MMSVELWIFFALAYYQVLACDIGWFGSRCQYKCHCADNSCDSDGGCVNGTSCDRGWFGTSCQYENLATEAKFQCYSDDQQKDLLTDNNDETCHKSLRVLFITWKLNHAIYWIRLVFQESGNNDDMTVSLKPFQADDKWFHNNDYVRCDAETRNWINTRTLDIYCEIRVSIHEVMIEGGGIKSLCSVYISGGRNLALKQKTWQSSTYSDGLKSVSSNAVDGNTDGDYDHGSCIHTGDEDMRGTASWSVQLSLPAYVNRFILYNRDLCCQGRLKGFDLITYTPSGEAVHQYKDSNQDALSHYKVLSPIKMKPISKLIISTAASTQSGAVYLNLCEVEVLGEWACPFGTYGLDCNNSCNCRLDNETCFVSSGGCPSGCAPGYQGEGCSEECESGSWGPGCSLTCDGRCAGSNCDPVTGQCTAGCVSGYLFPDCTEECPYGTWGVNCTDHCQKNCLNGSCDRSTGLCDAGCVGGYRSPGCSQSPLQDIAVSESQPYKSPVYLEALVILAASSSVVVLVLLAFIAALCWDKQRRSRTLVIRRYSEIQNEVDLLKVSNARSKIGTDGNYVGTKNNNVGTNGTYVGTNHNNVGANGTYVGTNNNNVGTNGTYVTL